MNKRHALVFTAAAFAASCINYTGLEGDGSGYTKPTAVTSGGGSTCTAADADDGTSAAASLGAASLDCQYWSAGRTLAEAMGYCAGLGSGWRLPSKGEALKIASSPNVCPTSLSGSWYTWTTTCAGAGLAWDVHDDGRTYQYSVDSTDGALCVR